MKKNLNTSLLPLLGLLCLLGLLPVGCTLYEEPDMSVVPEPGETQLGGVTLNLNLTLPLDFDGKNDLTSLSDGTYLHRVIVAVYQNSRVLSRKTVTAAVEDAETLTLPVSLMLDAQVYKLVVWSDYVKASAPDDDFFYNTETLVPLVGSTDFIGNAEYKDSFTAVAEVDLSDYAGQSGAVEELDLTLHRPMARYNLVATDVAAFLRRAAKGLISGTTFTAHVRYTGYLPIGYNALDAVPKKSVMARRYWRTFSLPAEGTRELTFGFDYLFVAAEGITYIPVEVELRDESGKTVALSSVRIPCEQGKVSEVRGQFLTTNPKSGIGFDADYDDRVTIDATVTQESEQ